MRRIYLDYAATTPVRKEVVHAMMPFFSTQFGNPGSLHSFGQEAMAAVDNARESIARILKTDFHNVIFCASATEANNLAIRGVIKRWSGKQKPQVIVSSIEHESVLETVRISESEGVIDLIILPVDQDGIVSLDALKQSLSQNTALVSIMYVNNEIGVIQPIKEISDIIKDFRNSFKIQNSKFEISDRYPIFHVDAVQAFSYFDCSFDVLGADMITLSGHKCGGPKGIGVFSVSSNELITNKLKAIVTGGGQEFEMRSGTENVQNIIGCARAFECVEKNRTKEIKRIKLLRETFIKKFLKLFPNAFVHGGTRCAPHIVNINIEGISREEFLTQADLLSIALSSGSACSARSHTRSHVLSAMYGNDLKKQNGIRASFGYATTKKDIDETFKRFANVFNSSR